MRPLLDNVVVEPIKKDSVLKYDSADDYSVVTIKALPPGPINDKGEVVPPPPQLITGKKVLVNKVREYTDDNGDKIYTVRLVDIVGVF